MLPSISSPHAYAKKRSYGHTVKWQLSTCWWSHEKRPQNETYLPVPWSWPPWLWEINFYCLPIYGILLWYPELTKTWVEENNNNILPWRWINGGPPSWDSRIQIYSSVCLGKFQTKKIKYPSWVAIPWHWQKQIQIWYFLAGASFHPVPCDFHGLH